MRRLLRINFVNARNDRNGIGWAFMPTSKPQGLHNSKSFNQCLAALWWVACPPYKTTVQKNGQAKKPVRFSIQSRNSSDDYHNSKPTPAEIP
ncbi:MAG: hypothetical protein IKI11_04970 [Neisseriaceae bacterium]|nr:hypothetical protein [Neisseriaceae bacterium]